METTLVLPAKTAASEEPKFSLRIVLVLLFYAIAPTTFFFIAWSKRADENALHTFYTGAHYWMFAFIFLIGMYALHQRARWRILAGFRRPKYDKSFWMTMVWTVAAGLIIYFIIYPLIKDIMPKQPKQEYYFYLMYVFFSCSAQAFLFLGVIYAEFKIAGYSDKAFVICSALNFTFLHIFYLSWVTLGLTFIAGIIWGILYSRHRNFLACAISHMLLGMLTILLKMI